MTSLVAAFALLATAQGVAPGSLDTLARAIDRVVERPAFAPALWGIEVRSLQSGRLLYARNAEKNLRPASTLKLVASAAALDAFGSDARFRTTVETAGRLDGHGRILGDVYLVGRGDPDLSARLTPGRPTAAFEELADALRAAGVRRIEGRLVGHEGAFTGERRGVDWGWEDLVWWYGAEVSALSFNDNAADLRLLPGERPGDPAILETSPLTAYYSVVSTVVTTPATVKAELKLERDLGTSHIRLSGTIPIGDSWEGRPALEDPARYATTVFHEVLEGRGIRVMGAVATTSDPLPPGVRTLAAHDSPPLSEIVKVVNKESQNLHTEMLLRLVGQKARGEGTVTAGHDAVREFLGRIGVRPESWGLQDGSGLSRSDVVDPHGLVELLAAMDRHPQAAAFRDSLAVMGVDGTLKDRMRGTPAQGKVLAKTGTLRLGNGIAGYATPASGERLVFAILVNNHTAPSREAVAAIDEIVRILLAR